MERSPRPAGLSPTQGGPEQRHVCVSGHKEHEGQQGHSWGTAGAGEGSVGRTGAADGTARARSGTSIQPPSSHPWETSS